MDILARRNDGRPGDKGGDTRHKGFELLRSNLAGSFKSKWYGTVFCEDLRGNDNAVFCKGLFDGFFRNSAKSKGGYEDAGIDDNVTFALRWLFS